MRERDVDDDSGEASVTATADGVAWFRVLDDVHPVSTVSVCLSLGPFFTILSPQSPVSAAQTLLFPVDAAGGSAACS